MKRLYIVLIFCALISCNEKERIKIKDFPSGLVVNANFYTDEDRNIVYVAYRSKGKVLLVDDADVSLYINDELVSKGSHDTSSDKVSKYYVSGRISPSDKVKLTVKSKKFKSMAEYTGKALPPPSISGMDIKFGEEAHINVHINKNDREKNFYFMRASYETRTLDGKLVKTDEINVLPENIREITDKELIYQILSGNFYYYVFSDDDFKNGDPKFSFSTYLYHIEYKSKKDKDKDNKKLTTKYQYRLYRMSEDSYRFWKKVANINPFTIFGLFGESGNIDSNVSGGQGMVNIMSPVEKDTTVRNIVYYND